MGKPVAGLNNDILRWVRERSGQSIGEVAGAINREPETIEAWENGEAAPTYVQLETLAYRVYKRPIALFFFPEPPDELDPEGSFRTLPEFEIRNLSADTRFKIRKARAFQMSLDELNEGTNPSAKQIFRKITLDPDEDVRTAALRVRQYLGIDLRLQRSWRYTRMAMEQWREAIQDTGVYVFKDTFKQKGVSGFCLNHEKFPIIYVNNSTPFSRQIFTLFHELAHLLLKIDGITKQDDSYIDGLTGVSRELEVFCNQFAGELLVPSQDFEAHLPQRPDDQSIKSLATRYVVSREVILRRLLDRNLITSRFYKEKVEEWNKAYEKKDKRTGGNYYATQASYLGDSFLKLAFSRYYKGLCTPEQLADHLNVRVNSLTGLESFAL